MEVLSESVTDQRGVRPRARYRVLFAMLGCMVMIGCATRQLSPAAPSAPPEYVALPDTAVCVVDRGATAGLREIPAKVGSSGVVLFVDGQILPLETVHPINVIAGYAGREAWLTRGEPTALL